MANLTYHPNPRGTPGYTITITQQGPTDAAVKAYGTVLPAFVQVDSTGAEAGAGTAASPNVTTAQPSAAVTGAIVPVVGAATSGIVAKASAGNFYGASVVNNTTAGFLIAYNATTVPAGGAALTAANILGCVPVAASGYGSIDPTNVPDRFGTGIVVLFSTSATTYAIPANLPFFLKGRAV